MRIVALILGLVVAAWGGTIAYRAFFLEPDAAVVINTTSGAVREYPNLLRASLGIVMLVGGACVAFLAARRKPL